ncbi:type VI secretion system protein ImpH [Rubrivivax gelatinosus]|nr:type VI secretion system protein ImpH [Rubrivivax gelatinosus]
MSPMPPLARSPIERLLAEPAAFAPYPALRLLRRWLAADGRPGRPRLRWRASTAMSAAAAEIESLRLRPAASGEAAEFELVAAFGSLLGLHGALPAAYTETLLERRDPAALAFVELFQQRLGEWGEQAWRHARPALDAETTGPDRLLAALQALAGLAGAGLPAPARAFHAGALATGRPSAAALERVLAHQFDTRVRVHAWQGRWHRLPSEALGRLGLRAVSLGHDAVAGARVWQRDLDLRLDIGPLPRARFDALLPGADGADALAAWWQALVGGGLDAEVRLLLRAEDRRPAVLGGTCAARLGFDAFLPERGPLKDLAAATLRLAGLSRSAA